jgi:sensor histidine kinase YesM
MSSRPPDNLLRRACRALGKQYYGRMSPATRQQAQAIDRLFFSRRGIGPWIGLNLCMAAVAFGLHREGLSWHVALFFSGLTVAALTVAATAAWLKPERFGGRTMIRIALMMIVAVYAGSLSSMVGLGSLRGEPPSQWIDSIASALWQATPFQLIAGLVCVVLVWITSAARRQVLQRELAQSRLELERDAAARQAAEAQLKLLQLQIQPHFLFNTLAALQHWVDLGDARAPSLLRALTAFLRDSTEMLGRRTVTVADEIAMARHYLDIMRARLGDRLQFRIDVSDDSARQELPPGLLMTLVENAIEHGIEPQLRGGELSVAVRMTSDGFVLDVVDNGPGLNPDWREGIGLSNCRERLRHRFGDAASLTLVDRGDRPGARATVRIDARPSATPVETG